MYLDNRFEEALTSETINPDNIVFYTKEYEQKRRDFLKVMDALIESNISTKRWFPKFAESIVGVINYIDTFETLESDFVVTQKSISNLARDEIMDVQNSFVQTIRWYIKTAVSDFMDTGSIHYELHTNALDILIQSTDFETYTSQDGTQSRIKMLLDINISYTDSYNSFVSIQSQVGFEIIIHESEQYIHWHTFSYDVSGDLSLLPWGDDSLLGQAQYFYDRYKDVFLRLSNQQTSAVAPTISLWMIDALLEIISQKPLFVLDSATVSDEVLHLKVNEPVWDEIGQVLWFENILFDLGAVMSDLYWLHATLDIFDDGSVIDMEMKDDAYYLNLTVENRAEMIVDIFIQDLLAEEDDNISIHWKEGAFLMNMINDLWPIFSVEWLDEYLRVQFGLGQYGEFNMEWYLDSEQSNLEMYVNDFLVGTFEWEWDDNAYIFDLQIDLETLFPGTGAISLVIDANRSYGTYPIDTPSLYIDWEGNF